MTADNKARLTPYEGLSLALLSQIASGIALQTRVALTEAAGGDPEQLAGAADSFKEWHDQLTALSEAASKLVAASFARPPSPEANGK